MWRDAAPRAERCAEGEWSKRWKGRDEWRVGEEVVLVIADYYGYQCSEAPFPLLMPPTPCRKRRTGFEDAEGVHVGGRKIRYSEPSSAVKGSETAPMTMPGGGVLAVAALAAATRLVTAVTILILLRAVTIFSGR